MRDEHRVPLWVDEIEPRSSRASVHLRGSMQCVVLYRVGKRSRDDERGSKRPNLGRLRIGTTSRHTNSEERAKPWEAANLIQPNPLSPIRRVHANRVHAMCVKRISDARDVYSPLEARFLSAVRNAESRLTWRTREACAIFAKGDIELSWWWPSPRESRLPGFSALDGGSG